MQQISIITVASLLFLAILPPEVWSRIPRDGVDPTTLEEDQPTIQRILAKTTTRSNVRPTVSDENQRRSGNNPEVVEEEIGCDNNPQQPGCNRARQEAEMTQAELRRVRIEVIKQKILQKLRLKAPPKVRVQRQSLPSLLLSNSEILMQDTDTDTSGESSESTYSPRRGNLRTTQTPPPPQQAPQDNFYGTTKNVLVFPDNSSASRIQCSDGSSVCLVFRLPREVFTGNVAASHLWLFKQNVPSTVPGNPSLSNQTLVVSEVVYDRQFGIVRKRIQSTEEDNGVRSAGGWLRLRVDRAVNRWVTKPHVVHALEVSCKGCNPFPVPVSQEGGHQPFLVLTINPQATLNRRRREVDCTNSTVRCCRESFYLSFKEINWDEWIIHPPGYTANYCRGTCLNDVSTSRYHHTTVMSKYLENQRAKDEEPLFSLCCTPSQMSPISMIYVDEEDNLFQKSLPNMVVETCDCA